MIKHVNPQTGRETITSNDGQTGKKKEPIITTHNIEQIQELRKKEAQVEKSK